MVDAGIGRLLIASLHQGIADIVPARLPFYENWLTPPGLPGRKFGLAPLHAVLSFLRLEGEPTYTQVMQDAGRYTAEWAFAALSPLSRNTIRRCPTFVRVRAALWLSRRLVVRQTFRGSTTRVKLRRGVGTIELHGSIFCDVRETSDRPLCAYYRAALARFLEQFDVEAAIDLGGCRASGSGKCTMAITIHGPRVVESAPEAA
jgi:hypothetical protein